MIGSLYFTRDQIMQVYPGQTTTFALSRAC